MGVTIIELLKEPDSLDLSPDLLHWLETGKELTPEQRQSLLEAINKLKG